MDPDVRAIDPSEQSIDLLAQLVAFNTVSPQSNLELIDYVYEYLSGYNIESHLTFNHDHTKANLYAVIGPTDRPGVALSGHTDVVPIEGQHWSHDPWQMSSTDERLYGRGTCDMKGFVAVVLSAVPAMLSTQLKQPIHLCFSYDEEIGCVGVRSLLKYLSRQEHKPGCCIVGEPTNMQVVNGHKGKLSARCEVSGHACHSALAPQGVNAVEVAARLINYLREMAVHKRKNGPFDPAFDIPYTTIHTGAVHGGTTVNIVPEECWFDFEFRHLPDEDPQHLYQELQDYAAQQLLPHMHEVAKDTGFSWNELARFPGLDTAQSSDVVDLAMAVSGADRCIKVAFGTEAGLFNGIGIPTVVCGPGSIEQAHKPDEFIQQTQLGLCQRFIYRLIERLAAS